MFTEEGQGELPSLGAPLPDITKLVITTEGIEKQLLGLDPSKSQGPDELPPWFLRMVASELAPVLRDLFQSSVNTGEVPTQWKEANITALFKKGSRADASNYRPVSLTVVVCKILEHIVHSHVMGHLERYNILTDQQHGFRAKRSTETQLILTNHDIARELNSKREVDVAILDFSKAFDKVPHQRLFYKLSHYGITGSLLKWVESFLTGRSQRVLVDGQASDPAAVTSGVPQGTVTGPLWFLLYINDLPNRLRSTCRLFADDCLLYTPIDGSGNTSILQEDLHTLEKWQEDWLMSFNPSKCASMSIATRAPTKRSYTFCGQQLESVTSHPYLGVEITNTLTWGTQTSLSIKKAQRVMGVLKRNLADCKQEVKVTAYQAIVRPLLEYATSAWDPHVKHNINALEKVQTQAARFCTKEYSRMPGTVTQLMEDLNWQSLQTRRRISRVTMFYKMVNGLVDINLQNYVVKASRQTRGHNQKYQTMRWKVAVWRNSFFPKTVTEWNELPASAVNCPSLESFKDAVKKHYQTKLSKN